MIAHDVGRAMRHSRALLEDAAPSAFVRRVWQAVAVDLLGSWSRTTETREHLTADVCRILSIDPSSRGNRSKVGAALAELRDLGTIGYRPATGQQPAVVTLPQPPEGREAAA